MKAEIRCAGCLRRGQSVICCARPCRPDGGASASFDASRKTASPRTARRSHQAQVTGSRPGPHSRTTSARSRPRGIAVRWSRAWVGSTSPGVAHLFYQAIWERVSPSHARVVQAVRLSFNFSRVCTSREKFLDGWTSWTRRQRWSVTWTVGVTTAWAGMR